MATDDRTFWEAPQTLELQVVRRDDDPPIIENGAFESVSIGSNTIIKRDRHLYNLEDARALAQSLCVYAAELRNAGVRVPVITRADIVQVPGGYAVEHEARIVPGMGLHELAAYPQWHEDAVKRVIATICNMNTLPGRPDLLRVGIDALARNWRIDADSGEIVYVDQIPVLLWNALGSLSFEDDPQERHYFDMLFGTKFGAIANLLLSAYQLPEHILADENGAAIVINSFSGFFPESMHAGVTRAVQEYIAHVARVNKKVLRKGE